MFTTIALFALGLAIPAAVGFFYPIIMERHHPYNPRRSVLPIGSDVGPSARRKKWTEVIVGLVTGVVTPLALLSK
jgi:hypothetical protein